MADVLKQFVAIAEETTYGTKATGNYRGYESRVDGFSRSSEFIDGGGQRSNRLAQFHTRRKRVDRGGSGSIEASVLTTGHGLILEHLLGSFATNRDQAASGGNPAVYSHTASANAKGPGSGYSIVIGRAPTVDTAMSYFTYTGCIPTGFQVSVDNGSDVMLNVDYDFRSETVGSTGVTVQYQDAAASDFFIFEDCKVLVDTTEIPGVKSFEVNADLNMDTERYFLTGSANKSMPVRMGPPTASGTIEAEFQSTVEYNRFVAGSPFKLTLIAEGATITGTHKYKFEVIMYAAQYDGSTPEMSTDGLGTISLPFTCLATSAKWIDIVYKTTDATA